jgi:hypothetical protein
VNRLARYDFAQQRGQLIVIAHHKLSHVRMSQHLPKYCPGQAFVAL